jgi:uncharacterized protein YllA (UPF0747 family)
MATEDHDFEEINYFNFKGRKFRWNKEAPDLSGDYEGLSMFFECMPRNWVQAPMRKP